jgi:integrase/recombinase XerD
MKQFTWEAKIIKHHVNSRIAVYFEKNDDLISRIKKLKTQNGKNTVLYHWVAKY